MLNFVKQFVINRITLTRFFILMGGIALFLMGVVNEVKQLAHNDPFWLRCVVSSVDLIFFVFTFFKKGRKYHKEVLYIVLGVGSAWVIYMLYANNFFGRYTTILYSLSFISLFFFEKLKYFVSYLFLCICGVLLAFVLLNQKSEEAYSFVFFYPLVSLGILYGFYYLLNSKNKITESVQLFESLIDSTIESYIMIDRNYKIIKLNNKAREGFKVFSDDKVYLGKSLLDYAIQNRNVAQKRIDLAFEGELNCYEFEVPLKNGALVYMESRYLPVRIKGEVRYVAISSLDVTDKRNVQKEIIEAKEKAELANKAKTEFLSIMSHEIRTPMNAVIGMTHLLKDESPTESQLEYINTLQFSAENLLVIINDILDYNKIEAGKIEFDYRSVSVLDEIKNVLFPFKQNAFDKRIALSYEITESVPAYIKADSTRLAQILVNLVSNAVKFTNKGSVVVKVSELKREGGISSLKFEVIDTGIGISPENQEKVFESFSQEKASITREFGGTGLGLSITKKLLELQGAVIHLESEKGKGSKFDFVLEVECVEEETDSKAVYDFSENVSLKNKRILLAEDNPVNQLVAMKFLEKWKVQIDTSVKNQLDSAKDKIGDYDLILMDLQMPVMDGFIATQKIRALECEIKKSTPILALTASALLEVQEQVEEASMDGFIAKPFNPTDLYEKISLCLR